MPGEQWLDLVVDRVIVLAYLSSRIFACEVNGNGGISLVADGALSVAVPCF